MRKKYFVLLLVFIIFSFILLLLIRNFNDANVEKNTCTLIKTYTIKNIFYNDDSNYISVMIQQFQNENIYTIEISKDIYSFIEVNKSYEFTLEIDKKNLNLKDDILFKESKIISIKVTDKIGLEQINTSDCN